MSRDLLLKLAFLLAGMPLVVYPFVLLANAMSLSAGAKGVAKAFLITSTLYPVIFGFMYWKYKSSKDIKYIKILFLYLAVVIASLLLWLNTGK